VRGCTSNYLLLWPLFPLALCIASFCFFIEAAKRDKAVSDEVKKNSKLLLIWYLVVQGFKTSKAIAKKLVRYGVFVTDRTVRNYLARLQQYGLVEQVGSGPHTVYRAKYIIVT